MAQITGWLPAIFWMAQDELINMIFQSKKFSSDVTSNTHWLCDARNHLFCLVIKQGMYFLGLVLR